ncbi:SDR family oxidoreductase [Nocardia sp. ET3-3]|uniref:SDR family oxidoreductase n=1 Tax=Nocardia terrae TaxID=2675851 RepID=A0A7K1UR76_9NOCA|nr:SDR family oxidoreductase [Nocardia terrae]MVU76807.1 SDR family oxidoreductase [Nocardia terrae]
MASRTWFVTGTSTGFGRELTEQLLRRGDRVCATVRTRAVMDDLVAEYGAALMVWELDVTDTPGVRRVVGDAFARAGRVDVVVSNAGYALFGAAEEVSDAQIRAQIDTNLVGSIQVARAVIPHLRGQGGGRLMQISSMGGQIAYPNLSLYHATKWGIEGFFEAVTAEVAPFGIQVTLVEPGSARTDFAVRSAISGQPLEIYEQTPVGAMRRAAAAGEFPIPGDPGKMAAAIIETADAPIAPHRLTLGSDAYSEIGTALRDRLEQLEAQKDLALSTDVSD